MSVKMILKLIGLMVSLWTLVNGLPQQRNYEEISCVLSSGMGKCKIRATCQPFVRGLISSRNLSPCPNDSTGQMICCPITIGPDMTQEAPRLRTALQTSRKFNPMSPEIVPSRSISQSDKTASGRVCNTLRRNGRCKEKDLCILSSGNGTCERIDNCEPFTNKSIPYKNLKRCTFVNRIEIICCPIIIQPPQTEKIDSTSQINRSQFNQIPERMSLGTTTIGPYGLVTQSGQTSRNASICNTFKRTGYCTEENFCISTTGRGTCKLLIHCGPFKSGAYSLSRLSICSGDLYCCPLIAHPPTAELSSKAKRPALNPTLQPQMRPSKKACEIYKATNPKRLRTHVSGVREARDGEFPHVGIIIGPKDYYTPELVLYCGVALVSQRFALTAANCARRLTLSFVVRFGSVETNATKIIPTSFEAKLKNIWLQDDNIESEDYHDLALLEFISEVPLSSSVHPACLHVEEEDLPRTLGLQVNGWSSNDPLNDYTSPVLYTSTVNTIQLLSCNFTHYNLGVTRRFMNGVHSGQYCARYNKGKECDGDVGFPLMRDINGQFEIVGIMSMEFGCSSSAPSIYTRVAYYIDWIEDIIWPELSREYVLSLPTN